MQYLAEMVFRYDADDTLVKKTPIYKQMTDAHFEEVVHIVFAPWIHGIRVEAPEKQKAMEEERSEQKR